MTDLVTALAERLRDVPNIHSSECAILDAKPCDCITFPAYELLACAALAFVAERLPTRLDVAMLLNGNSGTLWDEIGEGALCDLYEKSDNLLRDLRGRLGVKS